ncbi:MAG: hypothetical protein JNK63_07225 [Chthonomonas sp.]|nr:hypothetical protein [Chthonomonas sp.]
MQKSRLHRRAYSLVEVLFGIFLAGLCAMVLAATMPVSNNARAMANNQNTALSLAQKQMEALRAQGYPNMTADRLASLGLVDNATAVTANTYSFTNVDVGALDSPALRLPNGTGQVRVEQVALDLRRVTVILNWREKGRNRTVSVGTMVANL